MKLHLAYWFFMLGIFQLTIGQNEDVTQLLDSASYYFEHEKLEQARSIYASLADSDQLTADSRVKAYTGLITIAVFNVEFNRADSLILEVENYIQRSPTSIAESTLVRFQQKKGEYLRQAGKYEEALELHLATNSICKTLQPMDSALLAMSYIYVAAAYEDLSQYTPAIEYGEIGYKLCNEVYPADDLKLVSPNSILAVIYYRESNFDSAFVYYDRAIDILSNNLEYPTAQLAILYGNMGASYNDYGDSEKAISLLEKAMSINKQIGNDEGLGYNLFGIGASYFFLGDYGRAVDYMHACLSVRQTIYPEGHYLLDSPKEVIGIAQYESGNYAEGLQNMILVRDVRVSSFGPNSLPVAFTNENIAISYYDVGLSDSALSYMEKSMVAYKKLLPENHANMAHSYFNLARIYHANGQHHTALSSINKSNEIYKVLDVSSELYAAQNNILKGEILTNLGNFISAEESYDKAFALLGGQPLDLESSSPLITNLTTLDALNSYVDFKNTLHVKNNSPEFDGQLQQLNNLIFELSDRLRRQTNDPYTKGVLMRKGSSSTRQGINMNYNLYQLNDKRVYLNHLFEFSEYGRANLFRDMIDDYKVKQFAGIPDSLLQKELLFKQTMAEYNQAISEKPDDVEIRKKLFKTKEDYNRFIDQLNKDHPKYHSLKYKSNIVPIEAIQDSLLQDGATIIEYMADDTAYYGLIISKDKVDVRYVGNIHQINRDISDWMASLVDLDQSALMRTGQRLYGQLMLPLEASIAGEEIIIIPVGQLYNISFEALNTGLEIEDCLIYTYNISYAISVNTLFEQKYSGVKSVNRPVIIAPGFEPELKESYLSQLNENEDVDSSFLRTVRQPWSRRLANTLAKKFNGTALLDQNASEQSVKEQIKNRRIIHFATHAIADHQDPLRSKFILAKSQSDKANDGYLHAYEIYDLSLNSELAVLTACESGQGKNQEGEGMISLAYSINYAGCPSVVMSLWKIDEKINNSIIYDFYDLLKAGKKKSEALRDAKLKYLSSATNQMQHPFYWSGLVIMGDPGPVSVQGSNFRVWKWLLIFAVFFMVVLITSRLNSK